MKVSTFIRRFFNTIKFCF